MCTKSVELNHVIKELQSNCTEDTIIFRKLLNFASSCKQPWDDEYLKHWQPVFEYLIRVFVPITETGWERTLLASHVFFTLLSKQSTFATLKNTIVYLLKSKSNELCIFDKRYNTAEPELLRLICAHGYLQVNRTEIYSVDVCLLIFDVVSEHCIKYTKHSYFAYKILYMWLQRTMDTDFWSANSELEHKLERIIFSNWCNAINEISRQNSTLIFNLYLRIMEKKYNGYVEHLFKHCIDTISWQNELKYDILAEICEVCDKNTIVLAPDFLFCLCTSLTKYYLRSAGTKVYLAIMKKLNEYEWKELFGNVMNYLFHYWESTKNENHNALLLLCKHWLEPMVKRCKGILPYLWDMIKDIEQHFLRSHLQRLACEMHIELPHQARVECYLNHSKDIVRLNGFAIICYRVTNTASWDRFFAIKNFLWHNANSTTVYIRNGIVKYFRVFYINILKICDGKADAVQDIYNLMHWLHEFLLDCLEIGSCYQRKIFGLNMYRTILSFANGSQIPISKPNNIENVTCTLLVEKRLRSTGNWEFTNKKSLFILLRLALDSALDVKQIATSIILNYFDKNILSNTEMQVLWNTALKSCNSSKFYEAESGAALMSILANWLPFDILRNDLFMYNEKECRKCRNYLRYSDFLLDEASNQLLKMKEDILKAIVQDEPYYGVMTALLNVAFQNSPEKCDTTLEFIEKILHLLEGGTEFFLSVLSSKAENKEYSSSFAEMGLAIDDAIRNSKIDNLDLDDLSLTPAHQVLISCIWMSLKVTCELACEIGTLMHSDEVVQRSVNIIVTVLLKCRHKGVVEAAGSAIGHLTRCLCKEAKYSDLLKEHIMHILESDTMNSLNITRRGAGLSIMFHRVVVADNRRDRPFLHFAVQKLLDLLDSSSSSCLGNIEPHESHDSPWARRLHFLRTLVADKEIHAQLTPYMEKICLICFKYLESEVWTIRNASLQLFGAIVPRLVGQSYGDTMLDFGNGYSINHFVTHYPTLADHVVNELHRFSLAFTNFSSALYLHSTIVHILILLSKFSSSACNLIDYSCQNYVKRAKQSLRLLFQNPVWYVRDLAAKAYAALTNFLEIKVEVQRLSQAVSFRGNVNLRHGFLLTMKYLREKLSVEMENINSQLNVKQLDERNELQECSGLKPFKQMLQIWNSESNGVQCEPKICYILEALSLQLEEPISRRIIDKDIFLFNEDMSLPSGESMKPGFFQFIEVSTKLYTDYIKRTNNINTDIVNRIFDWDYPLPDQSISFLNNAPHSVPIMKIVLERLSFAENHHSDLILNAMVNYVLETLKRWQLIDIRKLDTRKMVENSFVSFEKLNGVMRSNLWNLKCILIILFSRNETVISEVLSNALNLSTHTEEQMRRMAAGFMQFSVHRFLEFTDKNKLIILHCCLVLLKDEISEIREAVAGCIRNCISPMDTVDGGVIGHDEYIYQYLLSAIMLGKLGFPMDRDMNLFLVKLFTSSIRDSDRASMIENPFYHEDNQFYREESKFLNLCFYYRKVLNTRSRDKCRTDRDTDNYDNKDSKREIDILNKLETRYELDKRCSVDDTNIEDVLSTKYVDYLLKKQKIVIQDYS